MLQRAGDFIRSAPPFFAKSCRCCRGHNDEEPLTPAEIYKIRRQSLGDGARCGDYMGVALAATVNIPCEYLPSARDILRVHLESQDYSRFIYVPTRFRSLDGPNERAVVFGEPIAVAVDPSFYVPSDA